MLEDFAPRLAQVMAGYSTQIKEGDFVYITTSTLAAPLVEALYEAVVERGGNPYVNLKQPGLDEIFWRKASDAQLTYVGPLAEVVMRQADVYIVIGADSNTKELTGVDPARRIKAQLARRHIGDILFERLDGDLRYLYTLWPTPAAAQQADMGLLDYREFVYNACGLDQADPVAHWQAFREKQERLSAWLAGKRHAVIKGPGIDMSFDFQDRVWISCHGDLNMPDGEIYTGPIEDSVNGRVEFSYPSLYNSIELDGIALTFKDGQVVEASAEKGEQTLLAQLDVDAGARRLGEFAIGTNAGVTRYTGNTLFDEKIGGTIHMALGNSIPDSKGVNQSSIHWDIVHGMQNGGEIWIDGELFYRSGEFLVG